MKIKKMLGHKTLRCKYTATSSRERDELGQEPYLRSQSRQIRHCVFLGKMDNSLSGSLVNPKLPFMRVCMGRVEEFFQPNPP